MTKGKQEKPNCLGVPSIALTIPSIARLDCSRLRRVSKIIALAIRTGLSAGHLKKAMFGIHSLRLYLGPWFELAGHHVSYMHCGTPASLLDLLAAAKTVRQNDAVTWSSADRRQKVTFGGSHGDSVFLRFKAEGPGHAATAGIQ
jgi:hypothetical protein